MTNDIGCTRKEARGGLKRCSTGKPRKHGYVQRGWCQMGDCKVAAEYHNQQQRFGKKRYRNQNKDKLAEQEKEYQNETKIR